MKTLIVLGAGGHCRPVIACAKQIGEWNKILIIDTDYRSRKESILGCEVIGGVEALSEFSNSTDIFFAVGKIEQREAYCVSALKMKFGMPNLVHPSAYVCSSSKLGSGNFVGPLSHIGPGTCIGDFNIINTSAHLEHEVSLGSFNNVGPGAIVCGRCTVGDNVFIGAGATVIEGVSINKRVLIGAGAVVVRDIDVETSRVLGVPGRIR